MTQVAKEAAARRMGRNACFLMAFVFLVGLAVGPNARELFDGLPIWVPVVFVFALVVLAFVANLRIIKADKILYGERK